MSGPIFAVRPVGDRGYLVELAENRDVHRLAAAVREHLGDGIEDVVPGEETLLLSWARRPPGLGELSDQLARLPLVPAAAAPARRVTISVRYDGADLEAVAGLIDAEVERVIELHNQAEYVVAFTGFAPGFAYLIGGSPRLALPRRPEPRPRVPAGSVAVASGYAAVYPTDAPGGWHLLGHTDAVLFDPDRDPPALLEPGMRVVFDRESAG